MENFEQNKLATPEIPEEMDYEKEAHRCLDIIINTTASSRESMRLLESELRSLASRIRATEREKVRAETLEEVIAQCEINLEDPMYYQDGITGDYVEDSALNEVTRICRALRTGVSLNK